MTRAHARNCDDVKMHLELKSSALWVAQVRMRGRGATRTPPLARPRH